MSAGGVVEVPSLSFSNIKVHNEIEFCRVSDPEVKKKLERAFLENHISYYERWEERSILSRIFSKGDRETCIICINFMQKEKAEAILESMGDLKGKLEMKCKWVEKTYF